MIDAPVPPVADVGDERLTALLRAIGEHDDGAGQLDSVTLGRLLGWPAAAIAAAVDAAKRGLLVWAIRVGGVPTASYEEIELTVQGRRHLAAAAITTGT